MNEELTNLENSLDLLQEELGLTKDKLAPLCILEPTPSVSSEKDLQGPTAPSSELRQRAKRLVDRVDHINNTLAELKSNLDI